jgi:hypothetical protein
MEVAPGAEIDLAGLEQLELLAANWSEIEPHLSDSRKLRHMVVGRHSEPDLRPLRDASSLESLVLLERPKIESLVGVEELGSLAQLRVLGARGSS